MPQYQSSRPGNNSRSSWLTTCTLTKGHEIDGAPIAETKGEGKRKKESEHEAALKMLEEIANIPGAGNDQSVKIIPITQSEPVIGEQKAAGEPPKLSEPLGRIGPV